MGIFKHMNRGERALLPEKPVSSAGVPSPLSLYGTQPSWTHSSANPGGHEPEQPETLVDGVLLFHD